MKILVAAIAGLALVACNNTKHAKVKQAKAVKFVWQIGPKIGGKNYSPGMPSSMPQDAQGYYFDFPTCSKGVVAYVTMKNKTALNAGQTISLTFSISGQVQAGPKSGMATPRVRLYFQRKGDDWNGSSKTEWYRWWSVHYQELTAPGTLTLSETIDPARWTQVYGKSGTANAKNFAAAAANPIAVGFTFGASFAGHGDCTNAPSRFRLLSFSIH